MVFYDKKCALQLTTNKQTIHKSFLNIWYTIVDKNIIEVLKMQMIVMLPNCSFPIFLLVQSLFLIFFALILVSAFCIFIALSMMI